MQFDKQLGDNIFLESNYVFNMIKSLIRHDLKQLFEYDDSSLFKSLGLFESKEHFENAVMEACEYGLFEHNLIYGLSFIAGQPDMETITQDLLFLQKLSLIYTSEAQVTSKQLFATIRVNKNFQNFVTGSSILF